MAIDPRNIEVIDEATAARWRAIDPSKRLRIASGIFMAARRVIRAAVRQQRPDWSDAQIDHEVRRRLTGGAA